MKLVISGNPEEVAKIAKLLRGFKNRVSISLEEEEELNQVVAPKPQQQPARKRNG